MRVSRGLAVLPKGLQALKWHWLILDLIGAIGCNETIKNTAFSIVVTSLIIHTTKSYLLFFRILIF